MVTTQSYTFSPESVETDDSGETQLPQQSPSLHTTLPSQYPQDLPLPSELSKNLRVDFSDRPQNKDFFWLFCWLWQNLDDDELKEFYKDVYDRWTWETGSNQDRFLMDAVENELQKRLDKQANIEFMQGVHDMLERARAEEIRKEIDRQILENLRVPEDILAGDATNAK